METSTAYESTETAIADDLPLEPDQRSAKDCWEAFHLDSLEPGDKRDLITLLLSDPDLTPDPDRRSEMSAEDAMFHYDLESLEPGQRRRLAEMLTQGIDPDPSKFNFKLWDAQAFSLSQSLWQIESIVGLAARAVDRDSELGDELHGALMAIAEICVRTQTTLEMDVMRPVEKQFKGN